MLLSLSWLREFTPYEGTSQDLGDRLTMVGLELEEIRHPFDHLAHLTTGHVVECCVHPDSDHLHVCKVDVGQEALLDIVCGAPNVAQGQKVAVATIGTKLPDGTVIKKSKLRGQMSFGMICSERELGLSDDHDGIMVLPETTKVGQRLLDVLPLDCEILDISITPNRADCLSILGLAREVAMCYHLPLTIPELPLEARDVSVDVPITITDPDICWLYSGRLITNLVSEKSKARIRYRLQASGIRAISNIVDVTNYILLECGQPLHAFDFDALEGGAIYVRKAQEGERFVTLDGQERILSCQDICICDTKKPVALAGVMGGLESEITAKTKTVFLESAVFHPSLIRKTSRRLGLSSESSYRFERGIDQQRTVWALDRACAMLASLGGRVASTVYKAEPKAFVPASISFSPKNVSALLGVEIDPNFSYDVLQRLGCLLEKGDVWTVQQPSWRPDITREADLIEEVGRVYGLDRIPPAMPNVAFSMDMATEEESDFSFWMRVRHWAEGLGLHEAINYSFVGHSDLDRLGLPKEGRITIMNPLSSEQDVLRTELAPGLLASCKTNFAQGASSIRLFEIAHVFIYDESLETHACEKGRLGLVLSGLRNDDIWPYTAEDFTYSDLRGIVEHFCHFCHFDAPTFVAISDHSYYAPAVAISVKDTPLGILGRVKPDIAEAYLAHKDIWICELDIDRCKKMAAEATISFVPLAVYPSVKRDITVMGEESLSIGQIMEHIYSLKVPTLEDVAFVSLYEPEGTSNKHLSFRLTFRHQKRTLKDSEVDKERNKIAQSLVAAFGVRI